jgi:predicted enzyme related to lactoylglutathione lyase
MGHDYRLQQLQIKQIISNLEESKKFYSLLFGNPIFESKNTIVFNFNTNNNSVLVLNFIENSKVPTGSSTLLHVSNVEELWNKLKDKVKVTSPLKEFNWGTHFGFVDNQSYPLGYYTKKQSHPQETQFTESVDDYKKSREFYESTLEFKCVEDWDRGEFDKGAIFEIDSNRLEIINRNRPNGIVPQKTGTILCIRVKDVWQKWEKLKDKVNVFYPLRESWKNQFSFGFFDVDGLMLEFFSMKEN